MLNLSAKKRAKEEKVNLLRNQGKLVGVLYGPEVQSSPLELDYKAFKDAYKESGESSLISLQIDTKKYLVLIHAVQRDPVSGKFLHVDFYQPKLGEKIETKVPLVFEGEAEAVKSLGGTLIKSIYELDIRALPQNLPKEIKVNTEGLKSFEDTILVKDLKISSEVEILRDFEEVVASIASPKKVEEEIEKPIEEVEKVEKAEEPVFAEAEVGKEEKKEGEKKKGEKKEEGD